METHRVVERRSRGVLGSGQRPKRQPIDAAQGDIGWAMLRWRLPAGGADTVLLVE
jgi:hypothetical protein